MVFGNVIENVWVGVCLFYKLIGYLECVFCNFESIVAINLTKIFINTLHGLKFINHIYNDDHVPTVVT